VGGHRLIEALRRSAAQDGEVRASGATGGTLPGRATGDEELRQAWRALENQFDATHGGFGRAPKFPQPVTLEFLMAHHLRTGAPSALEMAVHTLRRMAAGGMRDHLGGGFHRYSVDARWLVPHFEKMLYDNALLARVYLDAWRVTDSDDLRDVLTDTLDYLVDDMHAQTGGFYSARDADSRDEGGASAEGAFYVWTKREVDALLGTEESKLFCRVYDVTEQGNFEGSNILHLPHSIGAIAHSEDLSTSDVDRRLDAARQKLLVRRGDRDAPFRDEKVIVSWNGLAIRAFAEAGAALGRPDYVVVARDAADFIWTALRHDGRLLHSTIAGAATGNATGNSGFLDDHAALGNACLSLHAATLDPRWFEAAAWLADQVLEQFWDADAGLIYDTADDAEQLILRPRDPTDNATPSGPSLAAELLARMGRLVGDTRQLEVARRIVDTEGDALLRFGSAFGRMLSVLHRLDSPPVEIAIVGGDDEDTKALIQAAHARLHPNLIITGVLDGSQAPRTPLLEGRSRIDGRPAAYVCSGYSCRLPVTTPEDLRREVTDIVGLPGR
jgi:uncharacterized protein